MTTVESPVRESPAEIRRRLFAPAGGHFSTEIEIVPKTVAERMNFDNANALRIKEDYDRKLLKEARTRRAAELMAQFQFKLTEWVLGAEIEPLTPEIPKILFEQILIAVSKFYVIPRIQIVSHRRTAKCVRPRHVAMYLGREMTELSSAEIGRRLGGRDHTTCLFGANKIHGLLAAGDTRLADDIVIIRQSLEAE